MMMEMVINTRLANVKKELYCSMLTEGSDPKGMMKSRETRTIKGVRWERMLVGPNQYCIIGVTKSPTRIW